MKRVGDVVLLLINQELSSWCLVGSNVFLRHGTLQKCGPGEGTDLFDYFLCKDGDKLYIVSLTCICHYSFPLCGSLREHPKFNSLVRTRNKHKDIKALAKVLADSSVGRQR